MVQNTATTENLEESLTAITLIIAPADGQGSHWVEAVALEGRTVDEAVDEGVQNCAQDWGQDSTDGLHVLAVLKGDVAVIQYDDEIFH